MPSRETLKNLIDNDVPVHLVGMPGTAKTEVCESLAVGCGAKLTTLILSSREPHEVAGILMPSGEVSRVLMPTWAYDLRQAAEEGRPTLLLIDEYSTASPSLQAPSLRLLKDRCMDDWALPGKDSPGGVCRVMLASNPVEVSAGGYAVSPPAANRMAWFDWHMDYPTWAEWAMRATDEPPKWTISKNPYLEYKVRWQQALARFVGFLKARNLLFQLPEDPEMRSGPWPSPRTWHLASRVEFDPEAVACIVGSGAAAEYLQWKAQADLPDPMDVLAGKAKLPTRDDACYACIMQIVALAKADEKLQERAWELILGLPQVDLKIPPARALASSAKVFPPQLVKILPEIERLVK